MSQIKTGIITIATLLGDGVTKGSTYYLPAPDNQTGIELEWDEKTTLVTLYDGSEKSRRLGYVPVLTLSWKIYDDVNAIYGKTIGSAATNQLSYAGLLSVLDSVPGFLKVSTDGTNGFTCSSWKLGKVGVITGGFATGVSVTFRGSGIYSSKVLTAF
jgi:hypothetical protein